MVDFENKLDSLFAFLEPYLDKISIDLKLVDLPYGDKEYLSFVENEEFKISLENTNFFEQLKDCEKECILHDICNGGCLYENYCDTGKLINQCDFELLDDLNKRLFLYKLRELKYIQTSIEEEVQHVEAFSINI